jgi:hypothetical protein
VDDEVDKSIVLLAELSGQIKSTKQQVLDNFASIISMKSEVLKITRDTQRSHTFTNSSGDKRVSIGYCVTDGWRDTVEDGIAIVRGAVLSLIKDDKTKALVDQILRLVARDKEGNLKASKVLQLRSLANELHDERLSDGITIIEESYQPVTSKTYIRAEHEDDKGAWRYIPLGMTEA